MCTLTFINNASGVCITSNRDEHVNRGISQFPVHKEINGQQVTFPQDPVAGGTWLAASSTQRIMVLLNGAFEKHKHQPPYRLSRGLVLLDSFKYDSLEPFKMAYNFQNIEPFTLVHFDLQNQCIEEVRWDETSPSYTTFNYDSPHIWSSTTLYNPHTIQQRETWFREWLRQPDLDPQDMMDFHHFGGGATHSNSIRMERNSYLKTVSISQLHQKQHQFSFMHHGLLNDTQITTHL